MKPIYCIALLCWLGVAAAAEYAVPVRVAAVQRAPMREELSLTGTIAAQRFSNLSSRVDALVTEVRVEAGESVSKGDELIRLDKSLAEFDVKRSAAAVEEARAQLQESIRKKEEFASLIEKKYLAKTSYEAAVSDVRIKQAALVRLQAEHQRDVELLAQHVIKAPFDGIVSRKAVETGQWIKVGDSVLELVDIENLRVEVSVPQRYYSKLQRGMPAVVYPDALPGRKIEAAITFKIPVASVTARNFPVHIAFKNRGNLYTPGMTVRAVFSIGADAAGGTVLTVPRDAVTKTVNRPDSVWVVR
ncbi:MAG: efflux RND transporter periplasmic adaptor subunit, partial [Gammaproteobacteria bacterium]